MLLLSSATAAAVPSSTSAASAVTVPVPTVPAVRHRGVNLAEDVDAVDRVVFSGFSRDGRPCV